MLFTRTQRYRSQLPKEDFRSRLAGDHVRIHNLDFEVFQKGQKLRIVPHAEQEEDIKTLPITDVTLRHEGDATEVVVTSRIRKMDLGGPQLILLFCAFLTGASATLFVLGRERMEIYVLMGICAVVLGTFWLRMQRGYFDYVRKINEYVRQRLAAQEI